MKNTLHIIYQFPESIQIKFNDKENKMETISFYQNQKKAFQSYVTQNNSSKPYPQNKKKMKMWESSLEYSVLE